MATATLGKERAVPQQQTQVLPYRILRGLGSLKITVTLFALGIFIILFGTLAQDEMDLAGVKREYFNCWIARVPLDVFFPLTIFPHSSPYFGGAAFYFPGGATIGLMLLVNLIAAKVTRFTVFAKGWQFGAGLAISLLGALLITLVIISGHAANGLQGKPPVSYDTLWGILKTGCVVLTLALIGYAIAGKMPRLSRVLTVVGAAVALAISLTLMVGGESVRLDDPGLRIVWQLLQASIASCVLLAGLWMIFRQRGGNVLIHAGVGLLMVGQFVFGDRQIEQRIGLAEGESTNLAVIEDEIEIAIIDTTDPDEDIVYALPESLIRSKSGSDEPISDDALPFDLRIIEYMENSELALPEDGIENPATAGFGTQAIAKRLKPVGGAISDRINLAAAYVEVIDPSTDKPVDTFLLSQQQNDISKLMVSLREDTYESFQLGDKSYELAIRFKQVRKPYDVELTDVQRINYSGTETPRDYSSVIVITDRATGNRQEDKTWMNNPTRYGGETFYQSRYNKIALGDGQFIETTGLQVVENAGWVIPYVCCMMVFWGMFAHFGGTFFRFATRYQRSKKDGSDVGISLSRRSLIAAACLVGCGAFAAAFAVPKTYGPKETNWTEIASLPVQHEGRIKPLDSVARNVLQRLAEPIFGFTPTLKDEEGNRYLPSQWLMGVMAGQDWVRDIPVFRVYSKEARTLMDLPADRDNFRYSYAELETNREKLRAEMATLSEKEPAEFTFREQKLAQLNSKLNVFDVISLSYMNPPLPSAEGIDTEAKRQKFFNDIMQTFDLMQNLEKAGPPSMIPPVGESTEENLANVTWQAYGPARFKIILGQLMSMEQETKNETVDTFAELAVAVRADDATRVNNAVRKLKRQVSDLPLAANTLQRAETERWLNAFNPTGQGVTLYLIAVALGFVGFLVRWDGLRRAAFWVLVGVLVIHTVAIISRIYISGRAPVINLYSAAVFIGWACVLLGLVMECLYPVGVGNLVSGLIGVSTLSVARFLDTNDTMPVLQAVLDTQFWLSTHVVTVTAGYSVTYLAGFIGVCALVHRIWTRFDSYPDGQKPKDAAKLQKDMYSMCYGAVCFGIFFSFIGTVLGGLWADDSWGRFWGWDPKENGAMMIVLWNAILLHARWDKQVGQRGFAALAVVGNVITTWSFFGTNQLGIGLHAYGGADMGDESAPTLMTDPLAALRENGGLYGTAGFIMLNIAFVVIALLLTKSLSSGGQRVDAQQA